MKSSRHFFSIVICLIFMGASAANAQTAMQLYSAEQSSTAHGGVASRAIDGNTSGVYRAGSVTHTRYEQHPWWQASLASSTLISEIVIHNRTDSCCTWRLGKFYVYLSDQPFSADADRSYKLDNDPNVQQLTYVHQLEGSSITLPVGMSAKYVRIQIGTLGTLSLAEVEVKGVAASVTELSLSDASQSSTAYSGLAARAIDGNTSGVWRNGSVTHTRNESEPWWQAKLADNTYVSEVQLWNRTNCCTSRLTDFYVFTSDTPFQPNDSVNDLVNNPDVAWYFHAGPLADSNVTIPVGSSGPYVRIQLSGVGTLSLAEVKVFGTGDDNLRNYLKTLDVTTFNNFGGYGGFGQQGFGFNGINSQQFYPVRINNDDNEDAFLIDGAERTTVSSLPLRDEYWRKWEVQMGLANGYLHIVTTIYKSNFGINTIPVSWFPPLLLDSPTEIWHDESMEIYFNVGNESTAGYDDNDFVRIYRFHDHNSSDADPVSTLTGINSRLNLTDEAKCGLEEYGAKSCEARFSLEELGIAGRDVAEIGFDIHMNFDDDGGYRDAKYSWCSGDTVSAWRDMSVVQCSLRIINDCETSCDGF